MKRIQIVLPKASFFSSEEITGNVEIETDAPIEARGLSLQIAGEERTNVTVHRGKHSHTVTESVPLVNMTLPLFAVQGASFPPGPKGGIVIPAGRHIMSFRFQLAPGTLPTYRGTHAHVTYMLTANIDVPLWVDLNDRKELFIFRREPVAGMFPAQASSPAGGDKPVVQVSLPKGRYMPGEALQGTAMVHNPGGKKIRHLTISLEGHEAASARGHMAGTSVSAGKIEVPYPEGAPQAAVPFAMTVPQGTETSYRGQTSSLTWALKIELDIAFGFDVAAHVPVEIAY